MRIWAWLIDADSGQVRRMTETADSSDEIMKLTHDMRIENSWMTTINTCLLVFIFCPFFLPLTVAQALLPAAYVDAQEISKVSTASIPSVAITPFTTDDNSYRSAMAGEGFAETLQALLSKETDYNWVERSQIKAAQNELNLSALGLMDISSGLRIGKWVKADWLIMGHIETKTNHHNRALYMEVIDLQHADVLAERSLEITANSTAPLAIHAEDVECASRSLRGLLAEASVRLTGYQNQIIIAPLFFQNVSANPRLGFVEQDFLSVMDKAAQSNSTIRLCRFPKAIHAVDEAQLAVSGLVEQHNDAWRSVADVFVWGSYQEVESSGVPFPDVPVEFKLCVWDGIREVHVLTNKTTVAQLKETEMLIAGQIIELALAKGHGIQAAPDNELRERVANQLMLEADEIKETYIRQGLIFEGKESYLGSKWQCVVSLLQVARFIMPENARIQYAEIVERWLRLWPPDNSYQAYVSQNEDWRKYVKSFGVDKILSSSEWMVIWQYYNSCREALRTLHHRMPARGFPSDVPDDVYQKWHSELEQEYTKRALEIAPKILAGNARDILSCGLENINSANLRVQLCETYWPMAVTGAAERDIDITTNSSLSQLVLKAYFDAGQPERAEELLSRRPILLPMLKHAATDDSITPVFPWVDVRPVLLNAGKELIRFPNGFNPHFIHALIYHHGKLWISSSEREAIVWQYDPFQRCFDNISQRIGTHSQVQALCAERNFIWMALCKDGIWRIDEQSLELTKYTAQDGVSSLSMFSAAVGENGKLYFGGRVSEQHACGVMNSYDTRTAQWTGMAIDCQGGSQPGVVHHLAAWEKWLLVCASPRFFNLENHSWYGGIPFRDRDKLSYNMNHIVTSVAVDESGIWLGTMVGMIYFNPETRAIRSKYSVPEMTNIRGHIPGLLDSCKTNSGFIGKIIPNTRLCGEVTALANDGDFLWVATCIKGDQNQSDKTGCFVYLLHKASNKWVGYFEVSSPSASNGQGAYIGKSSFVTTMAIMPGILWLGMHDSASPLIEVKTRDLLSIPADKWIEDNVSKKEVLEKISNLSVRNQATYEFVLGNYADVVRFLANDDISQQDIEALFLLGWSYNSPALNQPARARTYFEEIIRRNPNSTWFRIAAYELVSIFKKQTGDARRMVVMVKVDENHVAQTAVDPDVESELTRSCKEMGFDVLDKTGDSNEADIVLEGEGIIQSVEVEGFFDNHIFSVTACLEIKAINRQTGKVIAVDGQIVSRREHTEQEARKAAFRDAADESTERLLLPILIEYERASHPK